MSEQSRPVNRAPRLLSAGFVVLLLSAAPGAQVPAGPQQPKPAADAPATASATPAGEPPAPSAYTYSPDGRRDPFVSLTGKGTDTKQTGSRPPGVPGLLINEISIKGIIRDRSGFIAMIQGADNRTYVVRAGDRLMDGTVKAIVQDTVVFSQDVNDPLSLVKQKEIRKNLRSTEGGRG
jgi:type IV pilus assembly protein PilP